MKTLNLLPGDYLPQVIGWAKDMAKLQPEGKVHIRFNDIDLYVSYGSEVQDIEKIYELSCKLKVLEDELKWRTK